MIKEASLQILQTLKEYNKRIINSFMLINSPSVKKWTPFLRTTNFQNLQLTKEEIENMKCLTSI